VFNSKKVSKERVMGISFVDILIQAVFLLLIILMVGYVDPLEQNKYEFDEVGKDFCNKIYKDSPLACVEHIKGKNILVVNPEPPKIDPSADFCALRNLSPELCKSTLDKIAANIDFWPCIPPSSTSQLTRSTTWVIHSPGQIEFIAFSNEYLDYLMKNNFVEKINAVNVINSSSKKFYSQAEIPIYFGFMKEDNCFHEYRIQRPGKFSDSDLINDFRALRSIR
jgi:hypothetical protein